MTTRAPSNSAAGGWAALREGRWDDARLAFERALATEGAPESYEGLSWSAWWLDDATTVFASRRTAYRLYRRRGDRSHAARMATWLAADELDFNGAIVVARGWIERARRLLAGLEETPDHGWLSFHEGFLAHVGGDPDRARECGLAAAEVGRRSGSPDLEMLGLALEGATLVASAQVDEGMRRLDEATALALEGEAAVPISGAWTFCFLVGACTSILDFERAYTWCDRIADFAERWGSRYMLAFCRAEYGALDVTRGHWQNAERHLVQAVEDFSASRPAWVGGPTSALADLRVRQGRHREATDLLDEARTSRDVQLTRARLALETGDARRAAEIVERLLRRVPPGGLLDRLHALELLVHARVSRGELREAESALDDLREVEARIGTPGLQGLVALASGVLAAAAGEHEDARMFLEDAFEHFDQCQMPFEAARSRLELATVLTALGRPAEAEAQARASLAGFLELGADTQAARARRVLQRTAGDIRSDDVQLTRREREVLGLVAEGLTNKQVAERLVVSEHTVHRHVTNILRKLDLPSRTAAAAWAVRVGLLRGT